MVHGTRLKNPLKISRTEKISQTLKMAYARTTLAIFCVLLCASVNSFVPGAVPKAFTTTARGALGEDTSSTEDVSHVASMASKCGYKPP